MKHIKKLISSVLDDIKIKSYQNFENKLNIIKDKEI